MDRINEIMRELAEYIRLQEQAAATVDALKDEIKAYMKDNNLDTLQGTEHKATFKAVTTNRIDSAALKKAMPDVYQEYSKETSAMRFVFV